jgi:hypothetical protein
MLMLRTQPWTLEKSLRHVMLIFTLGGLIAACAAEDQRAGVRTRSVSDLKLSAGNQVTQVEVHTADDGRVYFRYETKHGIGSCGQLAEVRELWTAHVINLPEAATASEVILDPTDPTGTSRTWRYRKQDNAWTEWFSPKCDG